MTMTLLLSTTLRLHLLLLGRLEVARILRLPAHPLHGVHHVGLLREEGVAEIGRPLDVVGEPLHDVGKRGQALDARVPVLLLDGVHQRLVLEVRVLRQPLLELHDLERIRGRREHLREERIRIESDGRDQRIELLVGYPGS